MIWDEAGEVLVDLLGALDVIVAGQETGIGVREPQRVLVALIGELEAAPRLDRIAQRIGDEARVIIAKHLDARVLDMIERFERMLEVAGAGIGPSRQQGRRDVMRLAGVAGRPVARAPRRIGPRRSRERRARAARGNCRDRGRSGVRRARTVLRVAIGEGRGEGALDQIDVAGSARRASRKYSDAASVSRSALADQRGESNCPPASARSRTRRDSSFGAPRPRAQAPGRGDRRWRRRGARSARGRVRNGHGLRFPFLVAPANRDSASTDRPS